VRCEVDPNGAASVPLYGRQRYLNVIGEACCTRECAACREQSGRLHSVGASGTDEAAVDASGAAVAFTSGLESDRFGKVLHGIHALFLSACSVASACESAWLWRGMITARSPPPPSCFVQRQHSPNCSGGGGANIAPTPGIPASRNKRVHDVMDGEASAAACEAIYRLTAAMVPCWMMHGVGAVAPPAPLVVFRAAVLG
jgi:hypothetical protein